MGPVVNNLPSNAGDVGLIPGWRTKILHAAGRLSPCATTTEPMYSGACTSQLERSLHIPMKSPHTTTKAPACRNKESDKKKSQVKGKRWAEYLWRITKGTICSELNRIYNSYDGSWRRQWHPTPVLLPGKSHGRRSLAAVHGVAKSQTRLSNFTFTFHFQALEKEMATHSSVLAWRITGTGGPGGLPSLGSQRVGHDWSDLAAAAWW